MLVDKRNKSLKKYEYSVIQFRNMLTKEVLNIGIILSDKKTNYIHIPKKYEKLKNCLDFTEVSGLKYTLDIIEDRIANQKRITYGEVSNSVFVTEKKSFLSEYDAEDALHEIAQKYMMIKKFREFEDCTSADKYDKISILKSISKRAEEKQIKNYLERKHYSVARKMIDMALVNKDKKPYVAASLVSLYKDGFDDNIITSVFTLRETIKSDIVKDQFLCVPVLKNKHSTTEDKSLGWAREQAQDIGVDFITDGREDAILERLTQYKIPKEEQLEYAEL